MLDNSNNNSYNKYNYFDDNILVKCKTPLLLYNCFCLVNIN